MRSFACPKCAAPITLDHPESGEVRCPSCEARIKIRPKKRAETQEPAFPRDVTPRSAVKPKDWDQDNREEEDDEEEEEELNEREDFEVVRPAHLRVAVSLPATILAFFASLSIGLALVRAVVAFLRMSRPGFSSSFLEGEIIGSLLIIPGQVFCLIAFMMMTRFQHRYLVIAALIYECIPGLSSLVVLGMPFAIWGLSSMYQPSVIEAFARNDARRS